VRLGIPLQDVQVPVKVVALLADVCRNDVASAKEDVHVHLEAGKRVCRILEQAWHANGGWGREKLCVREAGCRRSAVYQ
jgi:hypothetical protein